MRRLQITHSTLYQYTEPVRFLTHKLHVRPREGHDIRIESSKLRISPNYKIRWERDIYSNSIALVDFLEASRTLEITSGVVVQHYEQQPLEFAVDESALLYPFHYNPREQIDLIPYQLAAFPRDYPILQKWLEDVCQPGALIKIPILLDSLNKAIAVNFKYQMREEPGVQSPQQTIELGSGSCRDLATLFIEACRVFGFASRFVSGYLLQPFTNADQHSSTHAWSEVYLPGSGWRGFDSTSGLLVGGDHIAVAHHRHPEAIPPVSGTFIGPSKPPPVMSVNVDVKIL
ncbi:transglutaminase family protein [Methylomarinum vadi]|uniref:transglutaminase family protein n=1 Tax=Methylomarinum vadi TaxID=438855 RepID=UPI0004DF9C44|nr:transglutaminase family protein [Methylomarinum vadi]